MQKQNFAFPALTLLLATAIFSPMQSAFAFGDADVVGEYTVSPTASPTAPSTTAPFTAGFQTDTSQGATTPLTTNAVVAVKFSQDNGFHYDASSYLRFDFSLSGDPPGGGNLLTNNVHLDLYGLGVQSTPTVTSSTFYAGGLDTAPGATLLADNFITQADPSGFKTLTGQAFADYLDAMDTIADNAGYTDRYLIFRLSPDVAPENAANANSNVTFRRNTFMGGTSFEAINSTVVPESGDGVLFLFGGAVLTGVAAINRNRKSMRKAKSL